MSVTTVTAAYSDQYGKGHLVVLPSHIINKILDGEKEA